MEPRFDFTTRCSPFVEVGLGDARTGDPVGAIWVAEGATDGSRWSDEAGSQPDDYWSGQDPTWLDVTCYAHQWESFSGRHRVTDRFEPGTLTMVASNESGWADLDPTDITTLEMRPGRQIRVGVYHPVYGDPDDGYRVVLWRGYVDAVIPGYDPVLEDIVTVEAIDALGEVGRQKITEVDPPVGLGETSSARISRILNRALWPDYARDVHAASVQMLATRMGGQVADMLTQVADSEGGSVFGDTTGRVCYRPIDWQAWDTSDPPDDVIGNVIPHDVPEVPAHLDATLGTVSTPDPGTLPNTFTFVMRIQGPNDDMGTVASQWGADTNLSWFVNRCGNIGIATEGCFEFSFSPSGMMVDQDMRRINQLRVADDFEWLAFTITQVLPGAQPFTYGTGTYGGDTYGPLTTDDPLCQLIGWRSYDGIDWYAHSINSVQAGIAVFDGTAPLVIGAGEMPFDGSISWIECRNGETPVTGSVIWRFDAAEVPLDGTTYTDPRGRVWTVSASEAVIPYEGPKRADVCPTNLEISHRRSDITTQIILAKEGDEFPKVYDDDEAQAIYGFEPFEETDLVCQFDSQLTVLRDRLWRTRGYRNPTNKVPNVPRVDSVSFTAAKGDRVVDLLAKTNVFKPTRLRTRFARPRGQIYDRDNFVTGIEHFVSAKEWTCRMSLDAAAPFAVEQETGKWDEDRWNMATWAPDI